MVHSQTVDVEVAYNVEVPFLCVNAKILSNYIEDMSNTNPKNQDTLFLYSSWDGWMDQCRQCGTHAHYHYKGDLL